jgi:hypothetical protein
MVSGDWNERDRHGLAFVIGNDAPDGRILLAVLNAAPSPVAFKLPGLGAESWAMILDTTSSTGAPNAPELTHPERGTILIEPRSVILFRGIQQTG